MQKTAAILLTAAMLTIACSNTFAATQKKKAPPTHYVKGTAQLPGDTANFGVTYTLGKDNPFNITLKSAEYSVEPIVVGDKLYTVDETQKFLILHLAYQNPMKSDYFVRWDTFKYTVVDGNDQNHEGLEALGAELKNTDVSMSLKPGQKEDVFAIMIVPAASEMPKLMIQSSDDIVLRYNLLGKVKPLFATYADPSDKTGATALSKINAVLNTPYSIGVFSVKVLSAQIPTSSQLGETDAGDGNKLCVVKFSIKNLSPSKEFFRWDTLNNKLVDSDDVEIDSANNLYRANSDKSFEADIEPGQEYTFRFIYIVKNDITPKTLKLTAGRIYNFDFGEVK